MKGPGRLPIQVPVGSTEELPDAQKRPLEVAPLDALPHRVHRTQRLLAEFAVAALLGSGFGQPAVEVPLHQGQGPVQEVAVVVGQVRVETGHQLSPAEVPVLPERHLPEQEVPDRVHAHVQFRPAALGQLARHRHGVHHIPQRLADLLPLQGQKPVDEDLPGGFQARTEQHGRPQQGVEPVDVLPDEVVGGPPRPEALLVLPEADGADVVRQRVEPHVDHVAGIIRYGDPPRQLLDRPGHGHVLQGVHQLQHLRPPALRDHEVRPFLQQPAEPFPVAGQPEEVVLLLHHLGFGEVSGTAPVHQLAQGDEGFALHAVQGPVVLPVQVARRGHPPPDLLHRGPVTPAVRGANEVVVGQVQVPAELLERRRVAVHEGLHVLARLGRGVGDVLAVFVGPGEEEDRLPRQAVVAGQHVRQDLLVGVADVGRGVHVVDGGGDVEAPRQPSFTSSPRRLPAGRRRTVPPARGRPAGGSPRPPRTPVAPL
ncbi:hypothetical protein HRbin31_00411 [bacterium HR31]|nr:hypothetical protein HRbin31_00411 [bacterium HR31]